MGSCGVQQPERLMVFRKGLDTGEALVIRSMLEAAGVSVFLANENMASMHYAVAADIVIRQNDKCRAEQIMSDVSVFPSAAARMQEEDVDSCPSCGSTHVFKYVGEVPVFGDFGKSKAFPGSPWRKCLQCASFFRTDRRRVMGNFPLALVWGGTLGGFVYGMIKFFDWLKWL